MYQAKSGVKIFSLYWGGSPLTKKMFPQSEHVSSQIWCQKFFPLLRPGTPPYESVDRHTDWCQNITFSRTTYAGGNYTKISVCLKENIITQKS